MQRVAFLSSLAATAALPSALGAQALTKLRIAGTPDQDIVAAFWAQQSGIFQKYGIDADVTTLSSGAAITAAVVGGSLDIGKSSLLALIQAHAKGIPLLIIASSILYNAAKPITALVVAKDSPIRTGRDLNGATVAVTALGDFYSMMNAAWIDGHGGDSQKVHFVELPSRAAADAVTAGRVQATTLTSPLLDQELQGGNFRVLGYPFNAAANSFVLTAYFCTADFAAKNRDVLPRFRRALAESSAYANAHRSAMIPVISKYSGVDAATLAAMPDVPLAQPDQLQAPLIQPLIDIAVKYKAIPQGFSARELIDPALSS
jgi:NitT/TauT family transport system substrate-binding protein